MIEIKDAIIGHEKPLFSIDNLTLKKGHVYALIGRNGGGKTTFLNSLMGQKSLISGDISVNGFEIKKLSRKRIAQEIAYVSSKFEGVDFLSVYNYISLGKFPNSNWIGSIDDKEKLEIDDVVKEFKINHLTRKFTSEISDGERQLCAVARAIVQNTDIIILDEPSAFLDYLNRKKMIDLLINLSKEKNKCIVFSTHDLDLAMEVELSFLAIHENNLQQISIREKQELLTYFL